MADKAVQMGAELAELANGRMPDSRVWKSEVSLERRMPDSKNKVWACNACELLEAQIKGKSARVAEVLAWFDWAVAQPFMEGEELTSEEVYRGLPLYSVYAAAAVAYSVRLMETYAACLAYCKADVTYLLLGAGAGPGKSVRKFDTNASDGTILIGDGANISRLPFIAQAGMRSLIRNGDTFLFADAEGLSVMVAQALGLGVDKPKRTEGQVRTFAGIRAMAPMIPPFGFSDSDAQTARAYLKNPTDPTLARELLRWIGDHVPPADFEFVRYVDGSIYTWCWRGHSSSTDMKPIAAWLADGRTVAVSADDGKRSSSRGQVVTELADKVCCSFVSGGGPTVCYPKPSGVAEAWRLSIRGGRAAFVSHAPSLPSEPTPGPATPTPPKRKRKPWWKVW